MKKLISLITHGLGDWYLPLTMIKHLYQKNNCDQLNIYVDTIYDKSPQYQAQLKTGIKMLQSITNNYQFVPRQYFGSGDWYGCPNIIQGPKYENIKNDFCFYRKDILKKYMHDILQKQSKNNQISFFIGQGVWSYQWINNKNEIVDFSKRQKINFNISDLHKYNMNEIINEKSIIIHVRNKYGTIPDSSNYFKIIAKRCIQNGFIPILIGLKNEVLFDTSGCIDFRQNIQVQQCMYLLQECKYAILSSSMYTFHRFFSNKKTIITLPQYRGVNRHNGFLKEDLENKNYIYYNVQQPHLHDILLNIKKWREKNVRN